MSQHLRNLAKTAFEERAMDAVQTGSKLRSRVMEKTGVVGDAKRFSVIGVVKATTRGSSEDVVPANVANAKPTAQLTPSSSYDYIDNVDEAFTDVDAMRAYGYTHGKAVARDFDRKIFDALDDYDTNAFSHPGMTQTIGAQTVSNTKGTANKLDAVKLAAAVSMLMDYDYEISDEELTLAYPAISFEELAEEEKFASSRFVTDMVTETAKFRKLYNVMPIPIGNAGRAGGGGHLPGADKAARDKYAYLFARSAVGLATSTLDNPSVMVEVPQKRSVLIGAECAAGATRIQNAGIVRIQLKA